MFTTAVFFTFVSLISCRETNSIRDILKDMQPTPIVLWHGMGDTCCYPFSMGRIKSLLESKIPEVYVHSVMIGSNIFEDAWGGYFGNVNEQVEDVCEMIACNEKLKNGYHAVGFSQGGQFLRAVAQRCPVPRMKTLVSIGGQQQGVDGIPYCPEHDRLCDKIRRLLSRGAYDNFVQNHVVQAQYWHDPVNGSEYKEKSIFLADINNENDINETYKENLLKLENFVLVKFVNDSMVQPRESEWFGFYDEDTSEIIPLEKSQLYTEDRLGLRKLNEEGKLHFLEVEGDHLQISDEVFVKEIVDKYLR